MTFDSIPPDDARRGSRPRCRRPCPARRTSAHEDAGMPPEAWQPDRPRRSGPRWLAALPGAPGGPAGDRAAEVVVDPRVLHRPHRDARSGTPRSRSTSPPHPRAGHRRPQDRRSLTRPPNRRTLITPPGDRLTTRSNHMDAPRSARLVKQPDGCHRPTRLVKQPDGCHRPTHVVKQPNGCSGLARMARQPYGCSGSAARGEARVRVLPVGAPGEASGRPWTGT